MNIHKRDLRVGRRDRRNGQGMTEYIIIVVLVAIALIAAVQTFGGAVSDKFGSSQTAIESLDGGGESGGGAE